jgi:hypothetical protein
VLVGITHTLTKRKGKAHILGRNFNRVKELNYIHDLNDVQQNVGSS